ncbi:MAG: ECF-type sigma factor [Gemmatimonadota bacterium]
MAEPGPTPDITTLLELATGGDPAAADRLYHHVYGEMRALARSHLRRENDSVTMEPTALIHEAWLRLIDQRTPLINRGHFFGIAAQAMRRVLVDQARARRAGKRPRRAITLDDAMQSEETRLDLLLAVDEAVDRLAQIAPRQARVVELRWFADLEVNEVADILQISPATVKREWTAARAWLHRALAESASEP